jgi:hypothetical protein
MFGNLKMDGFKLYYVAKVLLSCILPGDDIYKGV